jgi:hypothetical protein
MVRAQPAMTPAPAPATSTEVDDDPALPPETADETRSVEPIAAPPVDEGARADSIPAEERAPKTSRTRRPRAKPLHGYVWSPAANALVPANRSIEDADPSLHRSGSADPSAAPADTEEPEPAPAPTSPGPFKPTVPPPNEKAPAPPAAPILE